MRRRRRRRHVHLMSSYVDFFREIR